MSEFFESLILNIGAYQSLVGLSEREKPTICRRSLVLNKQPSAPKIGAGQVTTAIPFTMNLSQGWNLIGNPYNLTISWNQVLTDNSDPADTLEQQDWQDHHSQKLMNAMKTLDQRSQEILAARWLSDNKATLQQLADQYQVSAERIRQLESNAMKKLKACMS